MPLIPGRCIHRNVLRPKEYSLGDVPHSGLEIEINKGDYECNVLSIADKRIEARTAPAPELGHAIRLLGARSRGT